MNTQVVGGRVVGPRVSAGQENSDRSTVTYRSARHKAQLWSSIGQLKEAERNGIISRELVAELSGIKRNEG